jgi:hypothetical protein
MTTHRRRFAAGPAAALGVSALAAGVCLPACRGTDELVASIGAHVVVVVDDDERQLVQLDIAGLRVRGAAVAGSNVVTFALPLDEGTHPGRATVFRVDDDAGADDDVDVEGDDDADDGALRPDRCGAFVVTVVADAPPPTLALVADDLPGCDDDADDDAEEEGVVDAGEGEGEGEGEVDEDGGDDPADRDGEDPDGA